MFRCSLPWSSAKALWERHAGCPLEAQNPFPLHKRISKRPKQSWRCSRERFSFEIEKTSYLWAWTLDHVWLGGPPVWVFEKKTQPQRGRGFLKKKTKTFSLREMLSSRPGGDEKKNKKKMGREAQLIPTAGSPTITLLRLNPNHRPYRDTQLFQPFQNLLKRCQEIE